MCFRFLVTSQLIGSESIEAAVFFVFIFVQINLALCFFNLIPLFPLDGSHVLENLLPAKLSFRVQQFNRQYGSPILLTIIFLGYITNVHIFSYILTPPILFFRQLFLGI